MKKDEKLASEAKPLKTKVPNRPSRPSGKIPEKMLNRMSIGFDRSFITNTMSAGEAIQDLHSRVNPKTARWHKSQDFIPHIVYTIAVLILYLIVIAPMWMTVSVLFGVIYGSMSMIALGLFGVLVVAPIFLLTLRGRYYDSLRPGNSERAPWYAIIPIIILLGLLVYHAEFGLKTLADVVVVILLLTHWMTPYPLFMGSWILGWVVIIACLGIYIKRVYFSKPKRARGISLGTAYQHYVNTLRYSSAVGPLEIPKDKPEVAGETKEFVLDYAGQPNPHALILGGSGSGKTTTLRAFLVRASLEYNMKFLIIDWNGESEGWAQNINATVWKAGKHFKINPFLLRGSSEADRASSIAELFQFGAHLTPLQSNMIRNIVMAHYQAKETPLLVDIWKDINRICKDWKQTREQRQYANWIDQRLRSVQRAFGTEPEEFWDNVLSRNNIISLTGLNEWEKSIIAYSVFQRIVELFNAQPEQNRSVRLLVVLDDAWSVLQPQKQEDQVFESLPSQVVRLGRKYGFGMVVSTQEMGDLPQPFVNSSAIKVIHNYRDVDFLRKARSAFGLGELETAYLQTAATGEGFVFDQLRAQNGQSFADYVKVRPLDEFELQRMRGKETAFMPEMLSEPEMVIDLAAFGPGRGEAKTKKLHWPPPMDRPTPPMFAGLLAIYNNKGKTKSELAKIIKEGGIVTSHPTIYGFAGSPGIFEILVKLGFAVQDNDIFTLTDKGLKWVDPERILDTDRLRVGGSLHEQTLVQTIKELHAKNLLVVVPLPEKVDESGLADSVDLMAYPFDEKRKALWKDDMRRGYEIQTGALNRVIVDHAKNAEKYGVPLTWVSWDQGVLDAIRKIRGEKDMYMLVRI